LNNNNYYKVLNACVFVFLSWYWGPYKLSINPNYNDFFCVHWKWLITKWLDSNLNSRESWDMNTFYRVESKKVLDTN